MDELIIAVGLLLMIMICVTILSWDLATNRFQKRAKERETLLKNNEKKYDQIIKRLEEDPISYAVGMGARYVMDNMENHIATMKRELGDK